jgi:hypothetical protein
VERKRWDGVENACFYSDCAGRVAPAVAQSHDPAKAAQAQGLLISLLVVFLAGRRSVPSSGWRGPFRQAIA